jgi:hypothetical protein
MRGKPEDEWMGVPGQCSSHFRGHWMKLSQFGSGNSSLNEGEERFEMRGGLIYDSHGHLNTIETATCHLFCMLDL